MEIYTTILLILLVIIIAVEEIRISIKRNEIKEAEERCDKQHDEMDKWRIKYDSVLRADDQIQDKYHKLTRGQNCRWKIEDSSRLIYEYDLPSCVDGAYMVVRRAYDDIRNDRYAIVANIYPYIEGTREFALNCAEELLEKLREDIGD